MTMPAASPNLAVGQSEAVTHEVVVLAIKGYVVDMLRLLVQKVLGAVLLLPNVVEVDGLV